VEKGGIVCKYRTTGKGRETNARQETFEGREKRKGTGATLYILPRRKKRGRGVSNFPLPEGFKKKKRRH